MSHLPLPQSGAAFTNPKTGELTEIGRRIILSLQGVIQVHVDVFANLPGSPDEGMLHGVSDSSTAVWGATIAGSGANHVLAYYDGTNWTVAGI